jgi:D-galactarolactone cycloisomerase
MKTDSGNNICEVRADWLSCPIPVHNQHVSDFGLMQSFDMCLVTITLENGLTGYGEAKAAVGSQGSCRSLAALINGEFAELLTGQDGAAITRIWHRLYNGPRQHYAEARGRSFPVLGRRGLWISAISGIDLALWDLAGKRMLQPVISLIGGAARDKMLGYASGGWADADHIGEQLASYTTHGFRAVKMRVGSMDGNVGNSVRRVEAARQHLGDDIDIMVDAHGTFSAAEAREFSRRTAHCNLRWFEEPISSDNRKVMADVRRDASAAIALGESEFTSWDFQDLIDRNACDILQPDLAICGGLSEGLHISSLAVANQLELAPHCWGSAISFMAGLTLAFASPAARVIEYSLGGNPLLHQLVEQSIATKDGNFRAPDQPGWGLTIDQDFVSEHTKTGKTRR